MPKDIIDMLDVAIEGREARLGFDITVDGDLQLALDLLHVLRDSARVLDQTFHSITREIQQPHARAQISFVLLQLSRFHIYRDDSGKRDLREALNHAPANFQAG